MYSRGTKRKEQAASTKKRIFETATMLFKENGFYNTSINDIAEKSGVSVGSFYYHFKCKEALLYILADEADANYAGFISSTENIISADNVLDLIQSLFLLVLDTYSSWGPEFSLILYSCMKRDPLLRDRMNNEERDFYRYIHELYQKGQSFGILRKDISAKQLAAAYVKAIRGAIIDWCVNDGAWDLRKHNENLVEVFLGGIKA